MAPDATLGRLAVGQAPDVGGQSGDAIEEASTVQDLSTARAMHRTLRTTIAIETVTAQWSGTGEVTVHGRLGALGYEALFSLP